MANNMDRKSKTDMKLVVKQEFRGERLQHDQNEGD